MTLGDTSVWIDHLHQPNPAFAALLNNRRILTHPFVIGELAVGSIKDRKKILDDMSRLPKARVATDEEVLGLIERERLPGAGIGYIDAHLLAATILSPGATIWTLDKRLRKLAERLEIASWSANI